jgi:small subunit ribosomal protein S30e
MDAKNKNNIFFFSFHFFFCICLGKTSKKKMGKVHGSLARAGKVKSQTPKVGKSQDKKKKPRGRAYKRLLYNNRFVNQIASNKKSINSNQKKY